jgi:hypothetical protein
MTKQEATDILCYVAQEIISPLAFDKRVCEEVWGELTSEKFNKLCRFVNGKVTE